MNDKELSIIIVNCNTKDVLRDCLNSIIHNTKGVNYEIIVVDNASSDGSAEMVRVVFPNARLIINKENLGYAKANNQGIRISEGKTVLLLNSDTVILGDCLHKVSEFIKTNLRAGIVGCKVSNKDGTPQYSCYHFPDLLSETIFFTITIIKDIPDPVTYYKYMKYWNHDKAREVECVAGCFLLARREVFERVGLLDEKFFIYYEDSEFCRRIRTKSSYRVYYYPDGAIIHLKGMSSGIDNYNELKSCYESATYYLRKCYGDKAGSVFKVLCRSVWLLEISIFNLLKFNEKFKRKLVILKKLRTLG